MIFVKSYRKVAIFMLNISETVNRIKNSAKVQGLSTVEMLEKLELNKNTLSTMSSRGSWIKSDSLAKIADYLNVSVDYLLGRDNYSNNGNSINTGDINGSHNATITTASQNSEIEKEISSILSELTVREKTELMTLVYKFLDEKKGT